MYPAVISVRAGNEFPSIGSLLKLFACGCLRSQLLVDDLKLFSFQRGQDHNKGASITNNDKCIITSDYHRVKKREILNSVAF